MRFADRFATCVNTWSFSLRGSNQLANKFRREGDHNVIHNFCVAHLLLRIRMAAVDMDASLVVVLMLGPDKAEPSAKLAPRAAGEALKLPSQGGEMKMSVSFGSLLTAAREASHARSPSKGADAQVKAPDMEAKCLEADCTEEVRLPIEHEPVRIECLDGPFDLPPEAALALPLVRAWCARSQGGQASRSPLRVPFDRATVTKLMTQKLGDPAEYFGLEPSSHTRVQQIVTSIMTRLPLMPLDMWMHTSDADALSKTGSLICRQLLHQVLFDKRTDVKRSAKRNITYDFLRICASHLARVPLQLEPQFVERAFRPLRDAILTQIADTPFEKCEPQRVRLVVTLDPHALWHTGRVEVIIVHIGAPYDILPSTPAFRSSASSAIGSESLESR